MKVVKTQKVTLTFGSGDTSQSGTLTGFTTLAQIIPFSISSEIDANSARLDQCKFDVDVTSTTNVTVTRGGSGVAGTVIVYVVELAPDVTVQKGTWTLGTGATTDDSTITAVTLANAFVIHYHKSAQATAQQPNVSNTASQLQSTTNVRIHVNTSGTAHDGHWFVVEHSDLSVQRGIDIADISPVDITLTAITLANSFVILSNTSTEIQYEDEGNIAAHISSTTNLQINSGFTTGNNGKYWQVIEDSDFTVQHFRTARSASASGNFTLTAVDLDFAIAFPGHQIASNESTEFDDAFDLSCRSTSYDITTTTNLAWAKDANNGSAVVQVVEFTEFVPSGPTITDAGDEIFTVYETNIVITGTTFGPTETGSAKVELGNNAVYASATIKTTQSIDTWSDTSIQFDLTIGTQVTESLWLYVTDSSGVVSNAWVVTVDLTPNITDAGDELFETTETNIILTGSEFLNTQGTGKIELVNNVIYASGTKVTQTIDTWTNTSVQFDLVLGGLTEIDLYLYATNDKGFVSAGYSVQILRTPTITNVEDEIIANNEQNVVLDGTYFQTPQSTGKLELADNTVYAAATKVTQTIDSWGISQIIFDVVKGGFSEGTYYLFVTNDLGKVSSSYSITLTAPPPEPLYKQTSIQRTITSLGLTITVFLIPDE